MYTLLKQIAKAGIVSEAPPETDESLRVVRQRLDDAILKQFGRSLAFVMFVITNRARVYAEVRQKLARVAGIFAGDQVNVAQNFNGA